jgi:nucleoid-associated protein YgaU
MNLDWKLKRRLRMFKKAFLILSVSLLSLVVIGCTVKTYTITKERVDQDLSKGNQGYLIGKPEVTEEEARKTTRELQVIEVEFPPSKIKQEQKLKPAVEPKASLDTSTQAGEEEPEEISIASATGVIKPVMVSPIETSKTMVMKKYIVRKNDTLQSISKKFYGTTKRWREIFEANREVLKSPNRIYPGQVIEVPVKEIKGK